VAKVSDQSNLSLERYFSQGLSGVTKRNASEVDEFKAFKQAAFLDNPNVERSAKKTVEVLLQNKVLDNYVLENLQHQLIQNETLSTMEYGPLVRNLAQALKEEAKRYPISSQEFKILGAASKLAQQLELGRQQYKEGRDALLPA
jgi:HSP90 family molecular chaperone